MSGILPVFPGHLLEYRPPVPERPSRSISLPSNGRITPVERARTWLLKREPAIEGNGGDQHTFTTACALVRGFELQDDEALWLMSEWNYTCRPPWSTEELRQKVEGARRYGSEPFGYLLDQAPAPSRNGKLSQVEMPSTRPGPEDKFARTDLGQAEYLQRLHGQDLRFCHAAKTWFSWDGARWREDEGSALAAHYTNQAARKRQRRALELPDPDERQNEVKFALRQENAAAVESTLRQLRTIPGMSIRIEELDPDPYLVTVANGTLDLRTGSLHSHRRECLSTKLSPIHYDPRALCPTWEAFLKRVLDGDTELERYLQRAAGYSLTGSVEEHCLFYLFGTGRNGKGTFLETLYRIAGDYGQRAPFSTFLARRYQSDGPRSDLARLRGARFVHASEANEGQRVDEALVKELTGGDTIAARFCYGDFFEFRPTHKLWWSANHRLVIRGTDEGIWSRIHLVPFSVTIPPEERDQKLAARLEAELPGILAWAVLGALEWRELGGLRPPARVLAASQEYREEMDPLDGFLETCCERDQGASVRKRDLFLCYEAFIERNGGEVMTKKEFSQTLMRIGIQEQRSKVERLWVGLRIGDR